MFQKAKLNLFIEMLVAVIPGVVYYLTSYVFV